VAATATGSLRSMRPGARRIDLFDAGLLNKRRNAASCSAVDHPLGRESCGRREDIAAFRSHLSIGQIEQE